MAETTDAAQTDVDADATRDVATTGDVEMVVATMIADVEILVVKIIAVIMDAAIMIVNAEILAGARESSLQDRCLRHHHLGHLDRLSRTVAAIDKDSDGLTTKRTAAFCSRAFCGCS